MRKKLSAILLTLAMIVTMMPVMAFATEENVEIYNLWVGGTQVTSENAANIPTNGGTASFDPATSTLTLDNATITDKYEYTDIWRNTYTYCIYSRLDELIIESKGNNQVGDESSNPYWAIHATDDDHDNNLIIQGDGTLNAAGSDKAIYSNGTMTISSGTINATTTGSTSASITADLAMTISGGTINATGSANNCRGIHSYNDITISGGTVNAISTGSWSSGISARAMTISGGEVNATATGEQCKGISSNSLTVSDGEVNATTKGETGSYAISGNLIVSAGKVTAITESSTDPAVYAYGNIIEISDGMVITKPEGGKVVELVGFDSYYGEEYQYKIITESDGTTPAKEVVIEPNKAPEPEKVDSNDDPAKTVVKVVSSDPVVAKMTAKGKKKLVLSWNKIDGADGYDVFFARCNTPKKEYTCKKVASLKSSKTTWSKKGLKARTRYKAYVKAYVMENGSKKYIKKSPVVRAYTGGSNAKYTNPKSVRVKKSGITVKAGKTVKVKATVRKLKGGKKLVNTKAVPKLRYLSSDTSVATVTSKGKVKGVSAGTCKVYAIAMNGVSKAVKVTVK